MTTCAKPTGHIHGSFNERAKLNYIQWDNAFKTEKPYEVISEIPDACKRKNFTLVAGPEELINDIRSHEKEFNLDSNAFEVKRREIPLQSCEPDSIEGNYLPAIKELLQTVDPGAEVHIFDWRLRSSDKSVTDVIPGTVLDLNSPSLVLEPVHAVHNDQSCLAAIKRAKHHLGSRADELLKRRFRIINVWRPIYYPIDNYPLAVCDGSTVPPDKLLAVDHVRKHYVGESLYLQYCEGLQWYFLSKQTKDELLLFKTFDSAEDTTAKCCPHTSFQQINVPTDANPRETIEVRALVFSKAKRQDDG